MHKHIVLLNDKTIIKLDFPKYRDLSVSRRSIICLCLRHQQIIDLLATDKSRYFAQSCPIIVYHPPIYQPPEGVYLLDNPLIRPDKGPTVYLMVFGSLHSDQSSIAGTGYSGFLRRNIMSGVGINYLGNSIGYCLDLMDKMRWILINLL